MKDQFPTIEVVTLTCAFGSAILTTLAAAAKIAEWWL